MDSPMIDLEHMVMARQISERSPDLRLFVFDRFRVGRYGTIKMAEGVSVHADTLENAIDKAQSMALREYGENCSLQFSRVSACEKAERCNICP